MAVVSISNLVLSETKNARNFQSMAMNCFVKPHDLMKGQLESYAYMQI